ncbi:hypothetical protein KAH81_00760 [bacterium]|nr:hypothetical protein [bacterium]
MPGKIGILFSGLGYETGTQIHEVTLIYRELEKLGGLVVNLIPKDLVPTAGRGKYTPIRDILAECSPILRGDIASVAEIDPQDLDGLIVPGGRGPITLLSDIEDAGADARVVRTVQDLIVGMHVRGKPIGSMGYGGALVMIALKRSAEEPIIVMGEDASLTGILSPLGIAPVKVGPQEVVFDQENLLFSVSGIAPDCSLSKGADGVEKLTSAFLEFCQKKKKKK